MKACGVTALLVCGVLSCKPSEGTGNSAAQADHRRQFKATPGEFLVIAHRGNSSEFPENTLAAIGSAVALGAELVEVDVRLSRDGVPVLMHDESVDRTTSGTGAVADLTLAELKALDAGAWKGDRFAGERVPSLAEALNAVRSQGRLLLDVPVDGMARTIAAVFASVGLEPALAVIGTWSPEQRAEFRRHLPGAAIFLSEGAPNTWDAAYFARQREAGVAAFEIPNWSPAFIAAAHTHHMAVYVYTVNDEPTMRVLIEAGADGIETDVPRLAIRVARELGVRR